MFYRGQLCELNFQILDHKQCRRPPPPPKNSHQMYATAMRPVHEQKDVCNQDEIGRRCMPDMLCSVSVSGPQWKRCWHFSTSSDVEKCQKDGETQTCRSDGWTQVWQVPLCPHVDCCSIKAWDQHEGDHWPAWVNLFPLSIVLSVWGTPTSHWQEQAHGYPWGAVQPEETWWWSATTGSRKCWCSNATQEGDCHRWNGCCSGNG